MRKYKVNINRADVSPEEISMRQDFEQVYSKFKRTRGSFIRNNWTVIYIIIIIILASTFLAVRVIKDIENRKKQERPKPPILSELIKRKN